MDAAQMLTAQEIARQCEQLARTQGRAPAPERRRLHLADPITQPIERIVEPPEEEPAPVDRELTDRELGILHCAESLPDRGLRRRH